MKNILLGLSTLLLAGSIIAGPTSKDAKEMHEYSKKICAKMSECVKKQMANMPAEQRKMMEGMFPTGDMCTQQYMAHTSAGSDSDSGKNDRKITKEEMEAMKKCMKDMVATSCEELMSGNQPKSCERFQD
ncbi:MAG: hypothetical protein JJT78_15035 [Leptospira sp.]|nr:hypothetical protein [Leptospira sp.]